LDSAERAALITLPPAFQPSQVSGSLVARFEAQVADTPDAVAISDGERHFSYRDLNARANQAAHEIQRRLEQTEGARDAFVGICMHRSAEQVIGILAILKAGAAYVPLDPDTPAARL